MQALLYISLLIPFVFTLIFNTIYHRTNIKWIGIFGVVISAVMTAFTAMFAVTYFRVGESNELAQMIVQLLCLAAFPSMACTLFCYSECNYIAPLSTAAVCAYLIDLVFNGKFVIPTSFWLILFSVSGAAVLLTGWVFTGTLFVVKEKDNKNKNNNKNQNSKKWLPNQTPKNKKIKK